MNVDRSTPGGCNTWLGSVMVCGCFWNVWVFVMEELEYLGCLGVMMARLEKCADDA